MIDCIIGLPIKIEIICSKSKVKGLLKSCSYTLKLLFLVFCSLPKCALSDIVLGLGVCFIFQAFLAKSWLGEDGFLFLISSIF